MNTLGHMSAMKRGFESDVGRRCIGGTLRRLAFAGALFALVAPAVRASTLAPPSDFRVSESYVSSGQLTITLEWTDNATNESGYILEESIDGTTYIVAQQFGSNVTSCVQREPVGELRKYRLKAFTPSSTVECLNAISMVTIDGPSKLTAYSPIADEVRLSWKDNTGAERGYKVERSDDGSPYKVIADLVPNTLAYTNRGLAWGRDYQYRVVAYTDKGNSWPAGPVGIAPGRVPAEPVVNVATINQSVNKFTPTSVNISWNDSSIVEQGYRIDRSADGTNWSLGITTVPYYATLQYVDRNRTPGVRYYYRVAAYNQVGDSPFTDKAIDSVRIPSIPTSTNTTTWYVDRDATGSADGASWANAWSDINALNWLAIKPGHTVYISGNTYNRPLVMEKSGAPGNPIVFRAGTDIDHNSRILFGRGINLQSTTWVTVDGAKNPAIQEIEARALEENINIEVRASGTGIYGSAPVGVSLRWMEVHSSSNSHGIWLSGAIPEYTEVGYCHVHDNWQDGINLTVTQTGPITGQYGRVKLHHNLIERNGDDGVQAGFGQVDIFNNVIREGRQDLGPGHADGIQAPGSYTRIYNNEIYDYANSCIFLESWGQTNGYWQIYNNVIYSKNLTTTQTRGIELTAYGFASPSEYWDTVVWREIVIANNTIEGLQNYVGLELTKRDSGVGRLVATNVFIVNNLIYNCYAANPSGYAVNLSDLSSGVRFANNIVSGGNTKIHFNGQVHSTAEVLPSIAGWSGNSSESPEFVDLNGHDYHLGMRDVAAVDKGIAWNEGQAEAPASARDLENRGRVVDGDGDGIAEWDVGAYEREYESTIPRPVPPTRLRSL